MEEEFYKYISQAEHLIEIERFQEAVPVLSKALAIDPQSYQVNGLLSMCFIALKNNGEAMKYADKTVESSPDGEWGHRLRSHIYTEMGWNREALESAQEAVRLDPEEPLALERLANAYISIKKPKEAKKISDELLELDPYSETSHFTSGNVHLALNHNWEAEQAFRRALEINPTSSNIKNNLGVAVLRQENQGLGSYFGLKSPSIIQAPSGTAEELFEGALRNDPGNETARRNFIQQNSYAAAIVPVFAFIPFMLMGFFVMPIGTIISYGITLFWTIKAVNHVRKKREEMTQEMRDFVKTKWNGEDGVLGIFSSSLQNLFEKTWKPHLLALGALVVSSMAIVNGIPGLRLVSIVMMIAAFWWLASESRKPDLD